jgi:ZIP family zinc transporter
MVTDGKRAKDREAQVSNRLRLWLLTLVPLLLLGVVLAYLITTGGGLRELAGPPIEQLTLQRVTLPEPGEIELNVVNDGPEPVTIAQVAVDEAYWQFSMEPSQIIPRLGNAKIHISYPWVEEEAHQIVLVTQLGGTFAVEIPVAVETPSPSGGLFLQFGLVGIYVGIVPVGLGMVWYPVMRKLDRRAMNFILSLTIGLLVFLVIGTWLDAMEFASELPIFWQGVPMVVFIALLSLSALLALSSRRGGKERSRLEIARLIAVGIGLHNLGEGLAIGAAFALGQAALGSFLVVGFTLHNITEGVGIVAPLVEERPEWKQFIALASIAGTPAILGTWIGSFAFNPILATAFLAIGVGAILQVVWEVGKLVAKGSDQIGSSLMSWSNLSGFALGLAIMYFTAFLVKF